MYLFFCYGVRKGDLGCMQVETVSRFAGGHFRRTVQAVAKNRRIQSVRMSSMNTELMRATCLWIEIDEESAIRQHLPNTTGCKGRFAVLLVDHLARTVIRVGQERKGDGDR